MADVINFQTEKTKLSSKIPADPASQLEDIRDQLMSLNTAFDRLSETLGEFGTHMHMVSKRLATVEERATQNDTV